MNAVRVAILSRYCHPFHRPGGLERMVYHHCRSLEALGVRVTLYTEPPFDGASGGRPASAVRFVPTRRLPFRYRAGQVVPDRVLNYPWFSLRLGAVVAAEAASEGFDVVQGNGVAAFGYAWQRAWRPDLPPLVFNPPGFEEFETPSAAKYAAYAAFRAMFRYAAQRAARVAAPDDCLVEKTLRFTGADPRRLFVLRNGVVLEECLGPVSAARGEELRRAHDLAGSPFVILSVGRISANKGFDRLARALGELGERLPAGWRWVHVGDGTARTALERLIAAQGIAASTRLTGFVDEATKHNLFALADVFVHPTLYEGSSIVTVEALAHGCPVVASRAGGIPDKVIDGESGRLVEPGDVDALARALVEVASLPAAHRRRWGERSRRLCEERFLWSRIAAGLLDVYRDLAAERSVPVETR